MKNSIQKKSLVAFLALLSPFALVAQLAAEEIATIRIQEGQRGCTTLGVSDKGMMIKKSEVTEVAGGVGRQRPKEVDVKVDDAEVFFSVAEGSKRLVGQYLTVDESGFLRLRPQRTVGDKGLVHGREVEVCFWGGEPENDYQSVVIYEIKEYPDEGREVERGKIIVTNEPSDRMR